jgi:hypothetical protein
VRQDEPIPPRRLQPTVPRDLETICLKCLRKEAGRRYAAACELAIDLGRFQAGEPVRAWPVGTLERLIAPPRAGISDVNSFGQTCAGCSEV